MFFSALVATRGGVYSVKRLILFYLYSIFNGRNDLQSEFHNFHFQNTDSLRSD